MPVADVVPYENNPRNNNSEAVEKVASSIKQFGFKVPVIIDENNIIVAGHTRVLAAKKLKMKQIPVIKAGDLNDDQVKAFRIADNRVTEESTWDYELLQKEIEDLSGVFDIEDLGFNEDELADIEDDILDDEEESSYTEKIVAPTYEPTEEKPDISDLYDDEKTLEIIERIEESDIPEKEKEFLKIAAYRHVTFDYRFIAEYYAHSDKEIQELMEESALVIIDYDKAIENGFIGFVHSVLEGNEGEDD